MNLRDRRVELGMTLEEVGKLTGVGKSTVRKWETGYIENMGRDKIVALSRALKISPLDILYSSDELSKDLLSSLTKIVYKLPLSHQQNVLSYAQKQLQQLNNSKVTNLDDTKPEKVPVIGAVPDNYDFAVQVNGDSMEPMLSDKQIIYVKKVENADEVRNNQFVIAEVDGEAFVKKLSVTDDGIKLVSLNKEYSDIVIHDYNDFTVVGVLVI